MSDQIPNTEHADESTHWVLSFDSTHAALAAQKLLASLKPYMIPTPREITANCGMALQLGIDQGEEAHELLGAHPEIAALCHWYVL